jgi:hypothetical protein
MTTTKLEVDKLAGAGIELCYFYHVPGTSLIFLIWLQVAQRDT